MAITTAQPTTERLIVDWEGYLSLPDDLTHYEIIDGEVIPLASPTLKHQMVSRATFADASGRPNHARKEVWARFLYAPYRLWWFSRAPAAHAPARPDVFLSRERLQRLDAACSEQPRTEQFAPDLVIEILSPSDHLRRVERKNCRTTIALGVPEVWLVDIDKRAIEVQVREAEWLSVAGLVCWGAGGCRRRCWRGWS
jgi:Uma2 family endonuclease